jgi:hypothetical protein
MFVPFQSLDMLHLIPCSRQNAPIRSVCLAVTACRSFTPAPLEPGGLPRPAQAWECCGAGLSQSGRLIYCSLVEDRASSKCRAFRRLRKLLVLRRCHRSWPWSTLHRVVLPDNSYLLSSMRIVSIVKSRFHCIRQGSLLGSTYGKRQPSTAFVVATSWVSYSSISWIDTWQVDSGNKCNFWRSVGITVATMYLQAVDSVFVGALVEVVSYVSRSYRLQRTCGGPRIVPFQFDMSKSSPSSRP